MGIYEGPSIYNLLSLIKQAMDVHVLERVACVLY